MGGPGLPCCVILVSMCSLNETWVLSTSEMLLLQFNSPCAWGSYVSITLSFKGTFRTTWLHFLCPGNVSPGWSSEQSVCFCMCLTGKGGKGIITVCKTTTTSENKKESRRGPSCLLIAESDIWRQCHFPAQISNLLNPLTSQNLTIVQSLPPTAGSFIFCSNLAVNLQYTKPRWPFLNTLAFSECLSITLLTVVSSICPKIDVKLAGPCFLLSVSFTYE